MKAFRIILAISVTIMMLSCGKNTSKCEGLSKVDTTFTDTKSVCELIIQPYNTFSPSLAKSISSELAKHITSATGVHVTDIKILEPVELDNKYMNNAKTRYRADKILNAQRALIKTPNTEVVGLIESDISTTVRGHKDWGILGLSYVGKRNCVVSTYRIHNMKRDSWKVVFHEFNHSFMGNPHCPADNPHCIMQDCKGRADFSRKNILCDTCSKMM